MVEIFQLQLHKSSAVPLYQQLAEGIEGMITDGVLLANSKLPPIRKTAEHFGVNSVTIVNAYKLLEKKQLVYSRVGSGTFVSPLPVEHIPEPVASRNLRSFESGLSMENAIILQAPLCRMKCSLWMRLRRRSMRCWIGKRAEPSVIWTAWAMPLCASSFAVIL